jgi:hypothetical protein
MHIDTMTVTISRAATKRLRDISADLEDRVKALEDAMEQAQARFLESQEKAASAHKKQMDALKGAIANYRNMLSLETALAASLRDEPDKIGPVQAEMKISMPAARMPLGDFFCSELVQFGSLTKAELRALAQQSGYFEGEDGGRQTHLTLVNIKRSGRVIELDGGRFKIVDKETASALE